MKKWLALLPALMLIVVISGCVQDGGQFPCSPEYSVVDQVILDGLENSDYIADLAGEGFELQRFRGPADSCLDIPDNYVHLNFWYPKGDFLYRLTIQTQCDPSTLTCNFNSDDLFEQVNYLESMEFISSRIESGHYKECEVTWLFGEKKLTSDYGVIYPTYTSYQDRVRYHRKQLETEEDDLDIYLFDNKIVEAWEGLTDRCADQSLICVT